MENKRASIVKTTMGRRKRKTLATVGMVVFIMAIIGVVTVALASVNITGRLLDNTKEKQKIEHFLLPMIMLDPGDFESPQQADPLMLLQSSIWSVLLSKERDQLTKTDQGVVIPASDVEVQAAKLYGTEVKLQHQSIDNYEEQILYDADKKTYSVPMISQMAVYTPRIIEITGKNDLYTLEVGYIPPGNLWQTDTEGNTYEPEPDKIMIVELKKVKGGYNILALKNGPDTQAVDPNLTAQLTPQISSQPEDDLLDEAADAAVSGESIADSVSSSSSSSDASTSDDSDSSDSSSESSSDSSSESSSS